MTTAAKNHPYTARDPRTGRVVPVQAGPANVRKKSCVDCACRKNSPLAHEALTDLINELAASGDEFSCHTALDAEIQGDAAFWTFRDDGVAVDNDGAPVDLCAGWNRYREADLRELARLRTRQQQTAAESQSDLPITVNTPSNQVAA